jgi:mono/diheme cytochrome c family protein
MLRHRTFMHQGVPAEYRGQTSTVALTEATIREGATLYAENCASCHGPTGLGDGEAGRALNPSPALLACMINMPMAVDSYLLWTISEGGKPFGTDMPAFRDTLTKEEIWKVIAFMRAGFPSGAGHN